jgi:hypothetical protein
MKLAYVLSLVPLAMLTLLTVGCQSSHEEGVKSDLHSQWTTVNADTKSATDAARTVLETEGLKDISANATNVDGMAMGKQSDGTKVNVDVKKVTDNSSEVSVTVGTMGDPKLGAEIARKIKDKAEMK